MTQNNNQSRKPPSREKCPLLPRAPSRTNISVVHKSLWKPASSTASTLNHTQTKRTAYTAQNKINTSRDRASKILTIIITKDEYDLPKYNATSMRDKIIKLMEKIAIARVHTSPNKNVVLSCHNSTLDELLAKTEVWKSVIAGWSAIDIQKINN